MSTKRYRLLKDLPTDKAGSVLVFEGGEFTGNFYYLPSGDKLRWEYVENNPEWFSEIFDRTEVVNINFDCEKKWMEFFLNNEFSADDIKMVKEAILSALNDPSPSPSPYHQPIKEEQGAEIKCVIEKGMVIECLTNENWDMKGKRHVVTSVTIPGNTVRFNTGPMIALTGLINGIENGRYKIVAQKIQEQPEERLRWSERKNTGEAIPKFPPGQAYPTKERTEVTFLSEFASGSFQYCFWSTKKISPDKFDLIKKDIESVLNDDEPNIVTVKFNLWDSWQKNVDILRSVLIPRGVKPDYDHHYKYTQKKVDEIEEAAFLAGRRTNNGYMITTKHIYPSYQDYKKSKSGQPINFTTNKPDSTET